MLPASSKLTSSTQFRRTLRAKPPIGARAGSHTVVVSIAARTELASGRGPRFGLVVSKAVGNAVTRHRVSRRLRHVAMRVADTREAPPLACDIVIRALPAAAEATSAELERDLKKALRAAERKRAAGEK